MEWTRTAAALLLVAACSGGQREGMPPRTMGASEHEQEAARHDQEAERHDQAAEGIRRGSEATGTAAIHCFDNPLAPDPTSGTERLPVMRPCWTGERGVSGKELAAARADRREAAAHRRIARSLRQAEQAACVGLGEEETDHSPFFHRQDIVRVEPDRRDGQLLGVRVWFRKVPGLDASWLRHAIDCHEARAAALGYIPTMMSYCPLMAAPTSSWVDDLGDEILVTIHARRDEQAAAILGRAQDLLR
jgi:hypothetical protein